MFPPTAQAASRELRFAKEIIFLALGWTHHVFPLVCCTDLIVR